MLFDPSSKDRLTDHDLGRFPDDTLFHRLARVVCHAGCLPRKELFEAWETAKRVRRVCRGGRVVDLGGGHGLLAHATTNRFAPVPVTSEARSYKAQMIIR